MNSVELSQKLADDVKSASNAPTSHYRRTPIAGFNFALSVRNNQNIGFFINQNAKVESIKGDKRHTQAVLNVHEPANTVNEKVTNLFYVGTEKASILIKKQTIDITDKDFLQRHNIQWLRNEIMRQSRIFIPGARRYLDKTIRISGNKDAQGRINIKANIKIKTPERENNLLVGIDEVAPFICALPEKANSVKEAHEILRPDNVPAGCLRQGEFFFVPVSKSLSKELDQELFRQLTPIKKKKRLKDALESNSSHRATINIKFNDKKYVRGLVYDTRTGRHDPIPLDNWHQVIRNNEIKAPEPKNHERRLFWD